MAKVARDAHVVRERRRGDHVCFRSRLPAARPESAAPAASYTFFYEPSLPSMSTNKKARSSARAAPTDQSLAPSSPAPAEPVASASASVLAAAQSPPSSSAQKRGAGSAKRKAAAADDAAVAAALPVAAPLAAPPPTASVSEAVYAAHAHVHIARCLSPHHVPASLAHTGLETQVPRATGT